MTMITPLYAAVFGLVFVILSVRTLMLRRKHQVAIGDGKSAELQRAARVHGNFAEYVPLALLLIFFLEMQTAADLWITCFASLYYLVGYCTLMV